MVQFKKYTSFALVTLLVGAHALAAKTDGAKKKAAPAVAEQVLSVDQASSSVAWLGTKVTGKHDGMIAVKSGSLKVKNGQLVGGDVVMDMTSISCKDIPDPDTNAKLVGHLKADDFFGTDKFPTASVKITKVQPAADGQATITGDFTIKGKTVPVTFPAKVSVTGDTLSADATVKLDRTKWDIRYGSGSFFKGLGDKVIHDEFVLTVALKAKK